MVTEQEKSQLLFAFLQLLLKREKKNNNLEVRIYARENETKTGC